MVEEAGPVSDRRLAVRANHGGEYNLNFALLDNLLGPETQGNVHLAIVITYYDDPALTGRGFRPRVYDREFGGTTSFNFLDDTPQPNIVLQGTDQWRDAYWEIGSIYLHGVGQTAAAARLLHENLSTTEGIHINRVRYAVVRPCGPAAGQNPLLNKVPLSVEPEPGGTVKVSWPYRAPQARLQHSLTVEGPWSNVPGTPSVEGGNQSVFHLSPSDDSRFYRVNLTPP